MIQKLKILVLVPVLLLAFGSLLAPGMAAAQCSENSNCGAGDAASGQKQAASSNIGNGCAGDSEKDCLANNKFIDDLRAVINILGGLVGVAVVSMVMVGGIQYAMARDNSGQIEAAQKRIANALIALVLYMLIFGFLQWLIPGGLFA